MTHHPAHLTLTSRREARTTPVVTIDGVTYGGTAYEVDILARDYYGFIIEIATDVRGADYGETVTIQGIEGEFNTDEDAADYIDNTLGENDEDTFITYQMEHSLRSWQLV